MKTNANIDDTTIRECETIEMFARDIARTLCLSMDPDDIAFHTVYARCVNDAPGLFFRFLATCPWCQDTVNQRRTFSEMFLAESVKACHKLLTRNVDITTRK